MFNLRTLVTLEALITFATCQDMGILNYQNQNYEAAEKYYNSILSTDSDNPEAHFGKGSSLFMQDDLKNAEIKFNESLASSETLLKSKAFYNLGNISYKNKKLNDALQFYKKALELNPNDDEARYNYEFIKYQKDPEEKKDEEKKDEEKKDEEKKDEEKKDDEKKDDEKKDEEKKDDEKKDDEKKDEEKKDEEKKDDEKKDEEKDENSQSQQKPLDEKKSQDLKKAESILDALKNDEKVMQKQQLQRFKTKKLLKDW